LPPANRPLEPSARGLPENGDHSGSFRAVGEGKIPALSTADSSDPTSATISFGQLQRQLAAESEGRSIDLTTQTKRSALFEQRADPTIIRAGVVEDLYLDLSLQSF
jgi:hypothetical protein